MSAARYIPHRPEPLAKRAREQYRLLTIGVLALLVLACAFPFSLNLVDPDLWGHVRYGQDWLAAGEMPRTATHTFTAVDHPWVNHENAAELLFALAYEHVGIYAMLVLKCALGVAIMGTMAWVAARHGVPAITAWSLLLLASANLQAFFPMRPQLLSFALCTTALVCLERAFSNWEAGRIVRFRWLWCLPVIFIAWVNSHGGFMAGLCIVGAYLLGRMIEVALDARPSIEHPPSRIPWRTLLHLAAIGLSCIAATVVNPYGLGMHLWLWNAWGGAPPEITEWAPPSYGKPVFWPFASLVAVTVACLAATRRRRDWVHIVILALVTWQACMHLRHIAFVALLAGFWLPVHWQSALGRLRPERGKLPVVLPALWLRLAMAAAIVVGIVTQSMTLAARLSDLPVLRSHYPVDAIQFMADKGLSGKAVVAFNWAQYAIAALAPGVTVGFDGRFDTCYPQEAIDIHLDFLLGGSMGPRERRPDAGPIDGARVLEYGRPDLVLLERRYEHCVKVMETAAQENAEWTLLYSDSLAQLWGRGSRYDDPASPHYLPAEERLFDVKLLEARFQWPALPDWSLRDASSGAVSGETANLESRRDSATWTRLSEPRGNR